MIDDMTDLNPDNCCKTSDDHVCSCGSDPCCGTHQSLQSFHWQNGWIKSPIGNIPRVKTSLLFSDRLGSWKARWHIGRMRYRIQPGLYAAGNPTSESLVFVTANFKMSFDRLRKELTGCDAWILVLDTKGINVWCAAGKGTFGTEEIVRKINAARLAEVVSHKKLVLPQLGAPGVSAHEVKRLTGFSVIYGPVRAKDLPSFIDSGMKATKEMRQIRFNFNDRIILVPNDFIGSIKYLFLIMACFFLLAGLGSDGYSIYRVAVVGLESMLLLAGAYFFGAALVPVFLPWLPGRAFSVKGIWAGIIFLLIVGYYQQNLHRLFENWLNNTAWIFIVLAITSFLAMNFTGSSTYTSLSGVRKEMRIAVPVQIVFAAAGFGMWLAGRFV